MAGRTLHFRGRGGALVLALAGFLLVGPRALAADWEGAGARGGSSRRQRTPTTPLWAPERVAPPGELPRAHPGAPPFSSPLPPSLHAIPRTVSLSIALHCMGPLPLFRS